MKTLEELSCESFYNMDRYSQITIDYIQNLEDLLSEDIPELETDVNAFFSLSEIVDKYLEDV